MNSLVNRVETDNKGNVWYLTEIGGEMVNKVKVNFDMRNLNDKSEALSECTPFATVIDKIGSLFANGKYYVVDKDGNELTSNEDIVKLLNNPNPIQTGTQFAKQVEMTLKVFGFCPVYTMRATKKTLPKVMYVIPPELLHLETSGKYFNQFNKKDIISKAYIEWGTQNIMLDEEDYFIIFDSEMVISPDREGDVYFASVVDSLSSPINNWMAQMAASNTLIVNGGPKGIICSGKSDEFNNSQLDSKEQKQLNQKFKDNYGLVNKLFSVLVTKANVTWIPMNYDASQLKLHEEDERCTNKIYNALGINPNVFDNAKYDNQKSADKTAYQNLIIPDSLKVSEAFTHALCPDGIFIKIDYTHIEALQKDRESSAKVLDTISNALTRLQERNLITEKEARKELANYIDINPDKMEK